MRLIDISLIDWMELTLIFIILLLSVVDNKLFEKKISFPENSPQAKIYEDLGRKIDTTWNILMRIFLGVVVLRLVFLFGAQEYLRFVH